MSQIILLGNDNNGVPRARMVKPGYDVHNPTLESLLFDSDLTIARIKQSGTVPFNVAFDPYPAPIQIPNDGYIPFVLVQISQDSQHLLRFAPTIDHYDGLTPVYSLFSQSLGFNSAIYYTDGSVQNVNGLFIAESMGPYMYIEDDGMEVGWYVRVLADRLEWKPFFYFEGTPYTIYLHYYVFAMEVG